MLVITNAKFVGVCFQGSFMCVRDGGARRLDSCGALPRRMRVQANDDSYEATKDRMARTVAAEQSKWYEKSTYCNCFMSKGLF